MASSTPRYGALYKYTRALSVALEYRDRPTGLHSGRVQDLAEALGRRCGMSAGDLGILRIGAAFHDIGKIGIPDEILFKPSSFSEAEWGTMRQHPDIGANIMLAAGLSGAREVAGVIRHHHERYDGSGYPAGLAAEAIPLGARIISIVDSYDAMVATRAYHRGRDHQQVMAVLWQETGHKHDPRLMGIFAELIEGSELKAPAT